jgi:hypothetical protein
MRHGSWRWGSRCMPWSRALRFVSVRSRLFLGFLPGGLPTDMRPTCDRILLSAAIMHIPDAELFDAAFRLRERAKEGKADSSCPCQSNETMSRPAMSATSWVGS